MKIYSSWVPFERGWADAFRANGIGLLLTPRGGRGPTKGIPWILDNGAYRSWVRKEPFDDERFIFALEHIRRTQPPDFIVVPDLVAEGHRSLDFSLRWLARIPHRFRRYLAVQDGMTRFDIEPLLREEIGFNGLFIGGTLKWKVRTGREWVELAHDYGEPCHIGRCGPEIRMLWAREIKADSIDSGSWFRNGRPIEELSEAYLASRPPLRRFSAEQRVPPATTEAE